MVRPQDFEEPEEPQVEELQQEEPLEQEEVQLEELHQEEALELEELQPEELQLEEELQDDVGKERGDEEGDERMDRVPEETSNDAHSTISDQAVGMKELHVSLDEPSRTWHNAESDDQSQPQELPQDTPTHGLPDDPARKKKHPLQRFFSVFRRRKRERKLNEGT